ncbi:MAG: response regulator [Halobacteriovoraceae bacterium]|nr:response regulator [Halobacteriovoraceae bacterium]
MAKILVADDSLTIQKVVGITMANGPYELVECLSEEALVSALSSDQFDLLLLDFNLSDSKTGYDLAAEIHKNNPDMPVLVMLGTFDSVDEDSLEKVGIQAKIVKPFESQKFLKICQELIESGGGSLESSASDEYEEEDVEDVEEDSSEEVGDQWVVDSPEVEDTSNFEEGPVAVAASDQLNNEMQDWGMEIPGVIGDDDRGLGQYPPVIETSAPVQEEIKIEQVEEDFDQAEAEEEEKVPETQDLEYPDLDFGSDFTEAPAEKVEPQLTSIDDFAEENTAGDIDLGEDTSPGFSLDNNSSEDDTNVDELKNELSEEVDEQDFWAVDEVIDSGPEPEGPENSAISLDQLDDHQEKEPEPVVEPEPIITEPDPISADASPAFDEEHIAEMIKDKISPLIVDLVREYCQQNVEKIAWEVIPDLAENLIKEEIRNISERNSHS